MGAAEQRADEITAKTGKKCIAFKCPHCAYCHIIRDRYVIAVYGTLKRGYGNNRLLTDAEYLGTAKLADGYYLLGSGGSIPYLSSGHSKRPKNINVEVELFAVTTDQLGPVDRLEGHPNFYRRVVVDVKSIELVPGADPTFTTEEDRMIQAYYVKDDGRMSFLGEKWGREQWSW